MAILLPLILEVEVVQDVGHLGVTEAEGGCGKLICDVRVQRRVVVFGMKQSQNSSEMFS